MCQSNLEVLTSKFRVIVPLLVITLFTFASAVRGADQKWVEVGVRFGFGVVVEGEDFNQLEIAASYRLPWTWRLDKGWILESRINASAGALHHDGGDTAAIVTIGPGLAWFSPSQQYTIEAGISPTLVSEHEFGKADFGGKFQFTSFIGLNSRLDERTAATFRVQHMSNASIYSSNPGLNQIMLGINYRL
jgi:lipid A 3-O-deacylase